ncbi:uncharacterized protein LOC143238057 isoform X3 [Tachypleus tridentatus]|uniref:uncharacterized protein LOC143238057 isoform X3 n=1 Tax=Tachypleus tridentatus TaxID=6853 RepID=UPI003FD3BCF3
MIQSFLSPFHTLFLLHFMISCRLSRKRLSHCRKFHARPFLENFQRPSKEPDSLGYGFLRFVSYETLKKHSNVKDDTLFIKLTTQPNVPDVQCHVLTTVNHRRSPEKIWKSI